MAKVGLTKLNLQKSFAVKEIEINDNTIEVQQYLPIQEKLELISRIINKSVDDKFYNPGKITLFLKLEVLKTYTNINITEKQEEEFLKTFDLLENNNIFETIMAAIPEKEINTVIDWLGESLESIYKYNYSAMGILENVKTNYNMLDLDITQLQDKIKDPESLTLLKELMPLLDLA